MLVLSRFVSPHVRVYPEVFHGNSIFMGLADTSDDVGNVGRRVKNSIYSILWFTGLSDVFLNKMTKELCRRLYES